MATDKKGKRTIRRSEESIKELAMCLGCPLYSEEIEPVPGEGSFKSRIAIIGEAPGIKENFVKRPFVGPAGALLIHIIKKLGLEREDFYITNVLKCYPKEGLPTGENLQLAMDCCWGWLKEELNRLPKNHLVILLGEVALKRFMGTSLISKHNGEEVLKGKAWATYHPAFALRNPHSGVELDIYRTIYRTCKRAKVSIKKKEWEHGQFAYRFA